MGAYPVLRRFTPEEYLRLERASLSRNEYVDGMIYAMAGGTFEHDRIIKNIERELEPQLRRGTCETRSADFRIGVSRKGPYFYPDLSVICGEPEFLDSSRDCALNPVAVFEVLSKSTSKYDRETKVAGYREIPSIRHIVLISQYTVSVEHHFRLGNGKWKLQRLDDRASAVEMAGIGATLTLAGIYRRLLLHLKTRVS